MTHDDKGGWLYKEDRMYSGTIVVVNIEVTANGERKLLGSKVIEIKSGENKHSFEI